MNVIESTWVKILEYIIKNGHANKKDDSDVFEVLGYHTFIKNILPTHCLSCSSDKFVEYIKNNYFDVQGYPMSGESIAKYLMEFIDDKCIHPDKYNDGFVYTYPQRILAMESFDYENQEKVYINQLTTIITRLYNNPGSNRAVANIYNCGLDQFEKDIPCLNWIQVTIRGNHLKLHVMFRSNDAYGAWPSNMFFLMYVGLFLLDLLKKQYPDLVFDGIDYHVTSLHIYKNDLKAVKNILKKNL